MAQVTVAVLNGLKVAADLELLARETEAAAGRVVTRSGLALLADVKRRAARPRTSASVAGRGPRLQTGNYNRSINLRLERDGRAFVASVGSNAVQARRLELGYSAPGQRTLPHPHFLPALDRIAPRFQRDMEAVLARAAQRRSGT